MSSHVLVACSRRWSSQSQLRLARCLIPTLPQMALTTVDHLRPRRLHVPDAIRKVRLAPATACSSLFGRAPIYLPWTRPTSTPHLPTPDPEQVAISQSHPHPTITASESEARRKHPDQDPSPLQTWNATATFSLNSTTISSVLILLPRAIVAGAPRKLQQCISYSHHISKKPHLHQRQINNFSVCLVLPLIVVETLPRYSPRPTIRLKAQL